MAMMKCPQCGKSMNSAPGSTCPNCGYEVPRGKGGGKKAPDKSGRFGKKAAPERSSSKKFPPAKKRTY